MTDKPQAITHLDKHIDVYTASSNSNCDSIKEYTTDNTSDKLIWTYIINNAGNESNERTADDASDETLDPTNKYPHVDVYVSFANILTYDSTPDGRPFILYHTVKTDNLSLVNIATADKVRW